MSNSEEKRYLKKFESGQTLIETVIGIFILVSGITAAVGLAVFAYSSTQNITKQSVAVGLAREGIEAVKNMRDTNWLRDSLNDNCYNPKTGSNDGNCYRDWIDQLFNLNPPNGATCPPAVMAGLPSPSGGGCRAYRLRFDTSGDYWDLERADNPSDNRYGLNFDSNMSSPSFLGFYTFPDNSGVNHTSATSNFARQIVIIEDDGVREYGSGANNPFNKNTGYRYLVVSRAWWTDKKCPRNNVWPGIGNCSVELRTYLTNWKNY